MFSHTSIISSKNSKASSEYAYVSVLYGNNEYFLGALMLGYCLSKIESKYDKVLLTTPDVPTHQIEILIKFYNVIEIPYLRINDASFAENNTIFRDVFTKFNVFNLIQYKKILLMDLDMLVLKNMDHLFELKAPAARLRMSGLKTGELCPPDFIKLVKNESTGFDEVQGGVNAGLMLLVPSLGELEAIMQELKQPLPYKVHEPEQDYLSYRYRGKWTDIDCRYNYQVLMQILVDNHQYSIHDLYNLHYSWYLNPWELLFNNREKVIFIIKNFDNKDFVADTTYFELWEQQFKVLSRVLKLEGIDILDKVNWTNMRKDFIEEHYKKCLPETTKESLLFTYPVLTNKSICEDYIELKNNEKVIMKKMITFS
jgi:lipopolysaccharide biosynthesis glycosyltransferase